MALIKSALEIALERTNDIKSDKNALFQAEGREEGKRLASAFFQDPSLDLAAKFKEVSRDRLSAVREGFFQIVTANLTLPRDEIDLPQLEPIGKALEAVIKDRRSLNQLREQLSHFFQQFLKDRKELAEAVVQQLGPVLRQKEAQISQQMGRPIRIDPMSDPDFAKAYNQNMGNLESRYTEILSQVKAQLTEMFEKSV